VTDKNIFCLISPNTFSYANIVASSPKTSGTVTLLGKATYGGSCLPAPLSLADGSLINIASRKEVSTVFNGSFYTTDQRTEPDFYLLDIASFYDRESLVKYLHELVW